MQKRVCGLIRTSLLSAIVVLGAPVNPGHSQDVGVTAATNPVATGQPPGQSVRELRIGLNIVRNERIRTTNDGATQVIFVDRTTLTIGPNSDITIDEYVYNPNSGTGSLAVRMREGLMKVIGGQISHSDQTRITTPTATLGIRGGMAIISIGNHKTSVIHLYGVITVSTSGNSITFSKPGFFVESNGITLTTPHPIPPGLLASLNNLLSSRPGQTGGAPPGLVTQQTIRTANFGQFTTFGPSNNQYTGGPNQTQNILSTRPQSGQPLQMATGGPGDGMGGSGGTGHHFHFHHHHHHHHFYFPHGFPGQGH